MRSLISQLYYQITREIQLVEVEYIPPHRSAWVGLIGLCINSHQSGPCLGSRTVAGDKESVREVRILETVCIIMRSVIVMGHCQGVISHPDILIFSRTASTTGTVFIITPFDYSFFINFRGALILCEISENIFHVLMFYLVTIEISAGVICDTLPTEGKHTGLVRITSTINIKYISS